MLETSLCYIEREGRILMLFRNRKREDVNKGKWIGVGGKLEAGETPEACMVREVREETGLTITDDAYRGIVDFDSGDWQERMHLFTAHAAGNIGECDEGRLSWIREEDILSLNLWEGDRVFLRLLRENRPFFRLRLIYDGEHLKKAILDGEDLPLA